MRFLGIDLDLLTPAERRDLANALLRAAWSAALEDTRVLLLDLLLRSRRGGDRGGGGVSSPHQGSAITERPPTLTADLPALLTVAETAEVLRVGRSWVYEHAAELGAVKLGRGQTAPLRIPPDGLQRIAGAPPPRRERRSVPARRAREAETARGELRARHRL